MAGLVWVAIVLLGILWFLGYSINVGWWINLLLVLVLLGIVYQLVIGPLLLTRGTRRTRVVHEDRVIERHDDDLP
ncbi:MAG: hypothetical protein ACYC4L_13190 [Chloroflexota bacterium]